MKKMYLVLPLILGVATANASTNGLATAELNERNTVVLRNVVDEQSVTEVQNKIIKLSQNMAPNENIYLYLDTPGGDIQAGSQMIATIKGLKQNVHTITAFAASMGYITVQSLGKRYILANGILMSHRARGGVSGQIPGEANVRLKFFTDMLDDNDGEIAKRVGMSKKAYQELIRDEHWVYGARAVQSKMADQVINVRCSKTLSDMRESQTIYTFFGPVKLVYSGCPLISAPLEVSFEQLALSQYDEKDKLTLGVVRKTILEMVYDKKGFYHDYILTNEYKKVIP